MQSKKILVTAALPYANGPLHFGHIAGCYLPADCYARFMRMNGHDVAFICGSDEYGVAITLSAEQAGRTPKEHVDIFHATNKAFFDQLHISFDHYSRTTQPLHTKMAQAFFLELFDAGFIEEKVTDQLYSEADGRFLADRYVEGTCPKCGFENARGDECTSCGASYEATDLKNPRSKLTSSPLTRKATKHWFMRFDKFRDKLMTWIKDKPWKSNVLNFAIHYIKDLKPRAITRDSDWGIPVPLDGAEGKVLYVWFDAPIGYMSATKEWSPDRFDDFWLDPDTHFVNFVGKDNIPFHAIFFPAMLMGSTKPYKLVDDLPANEFLQLEGKQFSKSAGWTIDLESFFKSFSADQIRYVLAANAPETQDSEFAWADFQMRCNSELVGKYGNLANRVLVFIQRHGGGVIPEPGPKDPFLDQIHALMDQIHAAYSSYHLRKASQLIMELCAAGNVYFDSNQPWKDKENAGPILYNCLECLKLLAISSFSIIPDTANQLWSLLGYNSTIKTWKNEPLKPGTPLPEPQVLFTKVEDAFIAKEQEQLHSIM